MTQDTCVSDLMGGRSVVIFWQLNAFLYRIHFLTNSFEELKKLNKLISGLEDVNDIAERGLRLLEEFKDTITDDEHEIGSCERDILKRYHDFKKSTLAKCS